MQCLGKSLLISDQVSIKEFSNSTFGKKLDVLSIDRYSMLL